MQANFMIGLGSKARVPIISFSATSPSLSSLQSQYFVRATLNDSAQVPAIKAIVQAFGWREVVLICVDNEYGNGVIPSLTSALQEVDTHVTYRSAIHLSATDDQIVKELYKLMTMSTRVFIVHMFTPLGSRLFTKQMQMSTLDPSAIDSMQGVLGVKPHVPRTKELDSVKIRWKKKFQEEYPINEISELNIFGLRAYDAASALAIAVEKLSVGNFSFQKTNISRDSISLESIRVSPIGPNILHSLLSTQFRGLTGHFQIVDGQLHSSAFQIVNVNGEGEKGVGFWTQENGIVRRPNSTSKVNLRAITWPGESTSVPKGWVLPTNGKKLKIGVPVKEGFSEFVKVMRDPITNTTKVTGYCIAIFDAVMATLPYAVPYEYVPFETPDGNAAGNYDELISQVYFQKYDAVVGDTTILANSLTSMLTVQQLKPTITDINELIRTGQRGSQKGGIAAAFDEIPYMKLFLAKYCSKYTAVQPTYKFDGFGFVFPKHSPLVSDVSMQILNVTEGDQMAKIEQAWFGQNSSCPGLNSSLSSDSIGVDSFWGLFLIAGVASSAALIIRMATFLYENTDTLVQLDPPASVWRKIKALATLFDNKDLSSHNFRKSEMGDRSGTNGMDAATASPATNYPPSPSSLSVQTQSNFAFSRDQATPASEYGDQMSPNGQTPPEIAFGIELANSKQELKVPEVVHVNN
ncbi:Glutamate receptor 2.3 [Vitis vinifera]|uniref:Glutamate receptor 2.3 n=1 Tax=Vitis vinifera TaxID=29760 RepID=A0A438GHP0_VITVI|nr:Glutamate receptor 2.3 [Vitis vinifera]